MTVGSVKRVLVLPKRGRLMVSTDLHGNWEDFAALRAHFLASAQARRKTHWVLLGDSVHGPSESARREEPALYGFEDRSWEIVAAISALRQTYPDRVHYVLGNHDHAHVGGLPTGKFYADEAKELESHLDTTQTATMYTLFESALIAVVAPCGLLLTHGSPDDTLEDIGDLDDIQSLRVTDNTPYHRRLLQTFLTHYGQRQHVTAALLGTVSKSMRKPIGVLVHGHDRATEGWYSEHPHTLGLVLFGAPRANRTFLEVNLAKRYRSASDLSVGREIKRLHES